MKKCILFFMLILLLCGCENQQNLIPDKTESLTEYDETYVSFDEDVLYEQSVQEENSDNEYKINTVDYSDIFHGLNGCAVIYDFNISAKKVESFFL